MKKRIIALEVFLVIVLIASFFDRGLSVGLLLLFILCGATFFILVKLGIKDKKIYALFLIVLAIHLSTTLLMHYTDFQPFSGHTGDYIGYQKSAVGISENFRRGDFSVKSIALQYSDFYTSHYYPVILGGLYALTMPKEIIGLMLNVWLVALSVIFAYLIMLQIGALRKSAFIMSLIIAIYPSYIFNTGLILKDAFEVFFLLLALLFLIRTIKKFVWYEFLIFYLSLIAATHFRFYIGYALIATFILSWFLFSNEKLKKRILYGIIFIILLGFVPQIIVGHGYYGINSIRSFLSPQTINFYRQTAYNPASFQTSASATPTPTTETLTTPASTTPSPTTSASPTPTTPTPAPAPVVGLESSFQVESGPVGYIKSFIYVLLGPFPWQIKNLRQLFALVDTFPWYLVLFFVVGGIIMVFKRRIKAAAPLIIFSTLVIVLITIFDSNFGLIVRIRIPVFICLLCIASLRFDTIKYMSALGRKNRGTKIKVCYVANNDSFVKFSLLPQLNFLKNQGYDVYVVCSYGKWIKDIEDVGIKVKIIKIARKITPLYDLVTLYKLANYFRKEKFDIVNTNNPKPGLLGQLAAKIAQVPIIINTVHGFYFQNSSSYRKRNFFITIEKIASKCSDLIFFVNKEDMVTASKEGIGSNKLIEYFGGAVNMDRFNPNLFPPLFIDTQKEKLGIKPGRKVIGIVARLVKEKGYVELFDAFKMVLEKFPNTDLLIAGSEEKEKKDSFDPYVFINKYHLEKNTIFLGERDDIEKIFPLMDIFVLPSHREGLGVAILEASAMEKPVVATDIRGCREAVEDGKTGILVPPKNSEKLAQALIYFLENPTKASDMGKNGRIKVVKEFDEKLIFDRIKKEYQRLIDLKLR